MNCGNSFLPDLWRDLRVAGSCEVELDSLNDFLQLAVNLIAIVLALAAVAAVIVIIVAGISYATSGGNPQQITKAKDMLVNAVIGLILSISAYAIVNFVVGSLV